MLLMYWLLQLSKQVLYQYIIMAIVTIVIMIINVVQKAPKLSPMPYKMTYFASTFLVIA